MPLSATHSIVRGAIAYLKAIVPDDGTPALPVAHADTPVIRTYNDELCVCYLVDRGSNLRYVQNRDLEREEISADELHKIGLRNLWEQTGSRNARVQPYQNIFAVLMSGDFEASLILLDRLWEHDFRQFVRGDYAAALPARDVLAFCDSSFEEGPRSCAISSPELHRLVIICSLRRFTFDATGRGNPKRPNPYEGSQVR